jgi:uncharacterized protein YceK
VEPAQRRHRRRSLVTLVILASFATSGCALEKHNWTYSLSRQTYGSKNLSALASATWGGGGSMVGLALAGMIFVLPIVIDTVFLPVTVTHDFVLEK